MRNIMIGLLILMSTSLISAQSIYNPKADAKADIAKAVQKAKKENKHVLIQVGGNWCPWCIKLHKYIDNTPSVNKIVKDNYVFILVNYSKENKNKEVMKQLEYPNRFGFPVIVVLDQNGRRIHTQNTGNLEKDKGYDIKRVSSFLKNWTRAAVNPTK